MTTYLYQTCLETTVGHICALDLSVGVDDGCTRPP